MTKRIAKRKLSDITFTHDGAHVALTSKDQGYSANGHPYALVMKSNFDKEIIEKIQQVRVTMELPEFLRKFFSLYGSDAEVLARMMGYVAPEDETETWSYEDWIEDQLESFEILKSANEGDYVKVLAKLSGEEYLQLLKEQEMLEKAFKENSAEKVEEGLTDAKAKAKDSGTKRKKVKPSDVNKGKQMDEEIVETVEKSAVVELQKAFDAQKEELQKALEMIEAFKAEKKEAITKSRKSKLAAVVSDEGKAEILFKAFNLLESEEEFDSAVKVLSDFKSLIEKSELFSETGVSTGEAEPVQESAVAKVLKSRLPK